MAKSREIFVALLFIFLLTQFAIINLYVSGFLFLFYSLSLSKRLLYALSLVLLFSLSTLIPGQEITSFGNYLMLILYTVSIFSNKGISAVKNPYLSALINILLLVNIFTLYQYPTIVQVLNFSDELNLLNVPNILKWLMINTTGSIVVVIYSLYARDKLMFLFVFLFLILAGKTTSLLLFNLGLFYIYNKSTMRVTSLILILGLVYITIDIPLYILNRINAILALDLQAEEMSRYPLFTNSLKTFLENPLLGIGYYKKEFTYLYEVLNFEIGHHSHIMDYLARFGIVFSLFIYQDIRRFEGKVKWIVLLWMILNNVVSIPWLALGLISLKHEKY